MMAVVSREDLQLPALRALPNEGPILTAWGRRPRDWTARASHGGMRRTKNLGRPLNGPPMTAISLQPVAGQLCRCLVLVYYIQLYILPRPVPQNQFSCFSQQVIHI